MEFILLGFGGNHELQLLLFLIFQVIYIVIVAGNILIIVLVVDDQHLHTPMYYLLGNLAGMEICYISTTLPRLLASLLTRDRTISVQACLVQLYFLAVMSTTEGLLLAAMSYDRYLAIVHPLRYAALMNGSVCCHLVAGSWLGSFLNCTIGSSFLFQLMFCDSQEIDHFFCDLSPMLKLSCSKTRAVQLLTFTLAAFGALVPLLLTLASYIGIITTILKIKSTTGRQKAFSTCSCNLIVIVVSYGAAIAVYMVPTANTPKVLHKIFSLSHTVLAPLINPVIYSLRNKEVGEALKKVLSKLGSFRKRLSS